MPSVAARKKVFPYIGSLLTDKGEGFVERYSGIAEVPAI